MPVISSDYSTKFPFTNTHFNTIYRSVFVKENMKYNRKRIPTFDADFIDLDFSTVGSKTIALLIHGLEGSSKSGYMTTTAKHLNSLDLDTALFNLRGCSGEDNKLLGSYHSGKTDDVAWIINYLTKNYNYKNIILIGFSLGGNLVLKYLGEQANTTNAKIKGAITISVPVDIDSSEREMEKSKNKIYTRRFLKTMKSKVLNKAEKFPDYSPNKQLLNNVKLLKDIENLYTVPVFGFKNPEDYWKKASSKPILKQISIPTLIINALDDPFLGTECYPYKIAEDSNFIFLETPKYGGHVGFLTSFKTTKNNWLPKRIEKFISEKIHINTI